ncbi:MULTISPECIES: glycosyltransferase [unclassified Thioalkalivibrio]|uniref:glycosyltransferase n=1 Tax=unclassified Thioalkalivibrio TaxID=2621013 RepID=UPI00036DF20C|nr:MULTISPECIES: glycosyltransferase [unclassified Thioalkalivibrio]
MLSDVYSPRINGVSTSLASFRAQLRQLGHRVTLVVPAYPGLGAHPGADPHDPDLIRIPSRYLVVDPEDRILKPRLIRRSLREAGIERADVVHVHTPFVAHYAGIKLARDWQVPVIETYHTFFEEYLQHYLPWLPAKWLRGLARRISRAQCNAVDRVIAPSTALHRALLEYGIKTPIVRLPTGIDPQAWTGGDGHLFRAERGIAPGREMLVHVSRIAFEKNIGFLLQMLQHLRERRPGVLLLIAGEGPARAALQRQAAQMGLEDNLHWCGYLDRETSLVDCYRAGHAFVFASATETQGLVLLEAMACGLPVVSTARLGTIDILTDASGAEVAPEEPAVFAERVARVLDDPERQRAMRASHAAWAREWSERRMAEQLLTVYQDLLSPADALGTPHTAADRPR